MHSNRSHAKNCNRATKFNVSLPANEALLTSLNKFWYGNHLFIQPEDNWQLPYKESQPKKKRKVSRMRQYYQHRNYNPYFYYNDFYNVNPLYPALAHYRLQTYERFRRAKMVHVPAPSNAHEVPGDPANATNEIPVPNLADQLLRIKRRRNKIVRKRIKHPKKHTQDKNASPVNFFQQQRSQPFPPMRSSAKVNKARLRSMF